MVKLVAYSRDREIVRLMNVLYQNYLNRRMVSLAIGMRIKVYEFLRNDGYID